MCKATYHKLASFAHAGETYALSLVIEHRTHVGHQCSAPDLEDDPSEVELLDVRVEDAYRLDGDARHEVPDGQLPDLTEAVNAAIESDDKLREAIEAVCLEAAADDYPDPD